MEAKAPGYDEKGDLLIDSVSFKIALQRSYDKAGDAFQIKIPILLDREPIVYDTFGIVKVDSAFYWKTLNDNPRKNTFHRDLIVSDKLAILKVLSALSYLMHYPHGCTEQKVSYAYPALAYDDIWGQLGLEAPDPHLKGYVNKTLEFLKKAQHQNGLFGYWPGSRGHVYLTAYITEFLLTVKKSGAGYNLDEEMLDRAINVLKRSLRSDYSQFLSGYKYYERCAAIHALTLAGEADFGYLRELASQTSQVDLLSQSRIYRAILTGDFRLGLVSRNLEKELWKETIFKLKEGKEVFGGLQQRNMRIGAQVHASEIKNLSGLISSFSLSGKSPEKVEMMVDELVTLGSVDGWGNTNVNSNALLSLRDYMQEGKKRSLTAELDLKDGNSSERIKFDGKKGALQVELKSKEAGNVSLRSKSRDEEFYVEYTQSYLPEKLGSAVSAEQHGFVVKRELIYVSKTDAPDKKVMLEKAETVHNLEIGDIIEEHIQVVNPKDRHFIAVSAPFAAGFEPLNPNLETSSSDANPSGSTTDKVDYHKFLDDKVVYYFDYLPAGTYDFYFRLRATIEGDFTHPPAKAEMMYDLSVNGNSPGACIVIKEEK
jgi:alpha-2-macroglobulin